MDYMMPEMDGLEACQAIVNNPVTSTIPVIMTTSNDTPEFRKRGVSSGAAGFLSKGLEDTELDNVLDTVTDARIDKRAGDTMAIGKAEISDETLAWIRDQAINAARKASEEYFTGQLPGLEEQVVKVAESAARKAAGGKTGGALTTGAGTEREMKALQQRMDNLHKDKQLRSVIGKMVREEGAIFSKVDSAQVAETKRSGFGKFLGILLTLVVLLVVTFFVLTMFFPDLPITAMIEQWVSPFTGLVGSTLSSNGS